MVIVHAFACGLGQTALPRACGLSQTALPETLPPVVGGAAGPMTRLGFPKLVRGKAM